MYDIPENFGFTILARDKKLAHITVDGDKVTYEMYSEYYKSNGMWVNAFNLEKRPTRENIERIILSRTCDTTLWRWRGIYKSVGFDEYLPFAYVKRLHGLWNSDGLWLMFDDEDDLEFRPPRWMEKGCPLYE